MSGRPDLSDYVPVAQRITRFRDKHPDGCLQPADRLRPFEIREIGGSLFIVVTAAAYRAPDDPRPGIGMAWEPFPGRTPYTRDSELMNAETSAWGRAIVAALAADTTTSIASAEEVRNRREDGLPVNKDGSLSRSRTTDEQKAAAGVMTSAQRAEHTKLRKLDHPRPAERVTGSLPDDQWTADHDGVTGDKPGSSTPAQRRDIGILYQRLGITEKESRLFDVRDRIGREITTSLDLSFREAAGLIVSLTQMTSEQEAG